MLFECRMEVDGSVKSMVNTIIRNARMLLNCPWNSYVCVLNVFLTLFLFNWFVSAQAMDCLHPFFEQTLHSLSHQMCGS